jgi:hypothetical protein
MGMINVKERTKCCDYLRLVAMTRKGVVKRRRQTKIYELLGGIEIPSDNLI